MEEKKKPQNGTFTQVPNVFLDTCDLPETAQILYLRLLRKIGYAGGSFTGSISELGKIVRYPKSTTYRLIKVLRDTDLINIEYNNDNTMTVTLNITELWTLNKYHYEVEPCQIWNDKQPSVSELERSRLKNETTSSQIWHESVPKMRRDQAQIENSNTSKTINNTKERKNDESEQNVNVTTQEGSSHSSTQSFSSQIILTDEEQRIIGFAKKSLFKARTPETSQKLKDECAELAPHIETQEQFDSLLALVNAKLKPPYHLKNMVNALNDWSQTQLPVTEPLIEEPVYVVTDEDLAEEVLATARMYQEQENFEMHLKAIERFREHFKLSNYDLCDKIISARGRANPERSGVDDFFYELRRTVM